MEKDRDRGLDEAASRSPSGGLRTQEEPCYEQQAEPRVEECMESQEQNELPWGPEPFPCPLHDGIWLHLPGSVWECPKTAVNFYNSPKKDEGKHRGVS